MRIVLLLILVCLFNFCSSRKGAVVHIENLADTGLVIRKWQVLGPFLKKDKKASLNEDNLAVFNLQESTLEFDDFEKIVPVAAVADSGRLSNKYVEFQDQNIMKFDRGVGNIYAGCVIRSDKKVKLRLNFWTYAEVKVWLNQKEIPNMGIPKRPVAYWHYLPLELNTGDNFLLIKANNDVEAGLEMYASIEKESKEGIWRHEQAMLTDYNYDFLETSLISDSTLRVDNNFEPDHYRLEVLANTDTLFQKEFSQPSEWKLNLANLSDGLYLAYLHKGNIKLNQYFFKGDIIASGAQVIKAINRFKMAPEVDANVKALVARYDYQVRKTLVASTESGTRGRQRRMLLTYRQLINVYDRLRGNREPFKDNPGTFIRTYASEIDNSVQHYVLHVPKSYQKQKPLPVVFNMAITYTLKAPYVESFRMNNPNVMLNYEELANKYNTAVVELNGRTVDKHNFNSMEETDFFEVLKSIKKDYSIDSSRIYLTGFCMGSWSALKLATKYPDKIAAVSINAASPKLSDIDNRWLQQNEPLNYLRNLKNVPILQVHSELDHHTMIEIGDKLNDEMKKSGLKKVTYNRLPPSAKYFYTEGFEFYDQGFEYLIKQKLTVPAEIHFSTGQLKCNQSYWVKLNAINHPEDATIHAVIKENTLIVNTSHVNSYSIDLKQLPYQKDSKLKVIENGKEIYNDFAAKASLSFNSQAHQKINISKDHHVEGPLARVFTGRFTLVTGSLGDQNETEQINRLADEIDTLWSSRYQAPCIRKKDTEVNKDDIENSNLVLLGNAKSNHFIKKVMKDLPLEIAEDHVKIGRKRMEGNKLGFYMIYPNPVNKQKYIAIIGYNNPAYASLGLEYHDLTEIKDISNYGWYDYKIWKPIKLDENSVKGYFDWHWE